MTELYLLMFRRRFCEVSRYVVSLKKLLRYYNTKTSFLLFLKARSTELTGLIGTGKPTLEVVLSTIDSNACLFYLFFYFLFVVIALYYVSLLYYMSFAETKHCSCK